MVPGWKSTTLYSLFGAPISAETLLVGIAGTAIIFVLNLRGSQVAIISHSILTYSFLAVVLCILSVLLLYGHTTNLLPLFASTDDKPWWLGSGSIFAFCAYGLNGFQAIPQAIEERSGTISLRTIGLVIIGSIAAAALFYCAAVIAASAVMPWRSLVSASLPMVAAASALPHGRAIATVLLIATAASLLKAWNGVFMMCARLLVAMARTGYVPEALARLHPRFRSPATALLLIGLLNVGGIFFGKGAIEPITDMCAMVLTLTYLMCCVTVLKIRATGASTEFKVPGGTTIVLLGAAGAALMASVAFISPFWQQPGVPLEWRLLGGWGAIGLFVWFFGVRGDTAT